MKRTVEIKSTEAFPAAQSNIDRKLEDMERRLMSKLNLAVNLITESNLLVKESLEEKTSRTDNGVYIQKKTVAASTTEEMEQLASHDQIVSYS